MTTAPIALIINKIEPSGNEGFTHATPACNQSILTRNNSYRKESPIIETKPMIHFSIFLYEFENSIIKTKTVIRMAPSFNGILKSIFKAIEPPRISASEVETEASTAKDRTDFETTGFKYIIAASERHRPVAIPRCATLCCKTISIIVESEITHNNV